MVALFLGSMTVHASIWHVNNLTGVDSHSGMNADEAVKTFAKVMTLVSPGDTVSIANTGIPYYETLHLRGVLGTAAKPLIIEGNQAVISGLRLLSFNDWQQEGNGFRLTMKKLPSHVSPSLFVNGEMVKMVADRESCKPGESVWLGDGFFYWPASSELDASASYKASLGDSGVGGLNCRYILIRNLVCEHHCNDGFNFHGNVHSVRLENITSRFNGDDGFSIHEEGEVKVDGGLFHNNRYGIEDVNASRSSYNGVTIRDNETGVHFSGGMHSLIGCELVNNRKQVILNKGGGVGYLTPDADSFLYRGNCIIQDSCITGGQIGVLAADTVQLQMYSCMISGFAESGLVLGNNVSLFLTGTVIDGEGHTELILNATDVYEDANWYVGGRIKIKDQPASFQDLLTLHPESRSQTGAIDRQDCDVKQQPFKQGRNRIHLGPGIF